MTTLVDARKEKIDADIAWETIKKYPQVRIAKGKKVLTFETTEENRQEILKHAMGRSGNLRAPAILLDNTWLIGFGEDMYEIYVK